jgi:hypothetical protein
MTDSNTEIPNPLNSMIYFLILTVLYAIFTVFKITASTNIDSTDKEANNSIIFIIYITFLVSGMYFMNLKTSKLLCSSEEPQYFNVFLATFFPWMVIFGTLYFLLELFNGWIKPFSNTIGYSIVKFLGAETKLEELIKKQTTSDKTDVNNAINNILGNKDRFINSFDSEVNNYTSFIKQLKESELITEGKEENNNIINEIYKFVVMKNIIGKLVWYFLAGTVVCAISFNYIVNQTCTLNVSEQEENLNNLLNSQVEEEE